MTHALALDLVHAPPPPSFLCKQQHFASLPLTCLLPCLPGACPIWGPSSNPYLHAIWGNKGRTNLINIPPMVL